jgi:hypothetical protein
MSNMSPVLSEEDSRVVKMKKLMGFNKSPPGCHSCLRRKWVANGVKPAVLRCTRGNFQVRDSSVCNEWISKQGETLT